MVFSTTQVSHTSRHALFQSWTSNQENLHTVRTKPLFRDDSESGPQDLSTIGILHPRQLLDVLIVDILSGITLHLLHVRYAFHIGILAGCANIIPHFGPIFGAVTAIFVVLMDTGSLGQVVIVTLCFVGIQLFDYLFISQMVVFKNIHIHPLIVVDVVLIGGYLMGVVGMSVSLLLLVF